MSLNYRDRRLFGFQRTGTGGFQKSKEPPNTGLGATAVKQNDFLFIIGGWGAGTASLNSNGSLV